jgi:hydrogenase nickel incorporation protein HypA/HybF
MHELAIAEEIVFAVSERAAGARVRRIVVEIGRLSSALPDALSYCFDLCVEDTDLEGVELEIVEVPGRALCRACGASVDLDQPFGRCGCGSTELDWLSGEELTITRVELA